MSDVADAGIVQVRSAFPVGETVEKLRGLLSAKGITLFALIDHSGEAAKAGLTMPDTKLLIFGNPKAGTPVMLAAPTSALDLPLKILVREDPGLGPSAVIEYNSAAWLAARHGVPGELLGVLDAVAGLAAQVVGSAPFR